MCSRRHKTQGVFCAILDSSSIRPMGKGQVFSLIYLESINLIVRAALFFFHFPLTHFSTERMIANYKFSGKEPLRETVLSACNEKPKLLERKKIFDRVVLKLLDIIAKFDDAMGEFEEEEQGVYTKNPELVKLDIFNIGMMTALERVRLRNED